MPKSRFAAAGRDFLIYKKTMPLNFDKYNQEVTAWMQQTQNSFVSQASSLGIEHRGNSPSSSSSISKIKTRSRLKDGAIYNIGFNFPRTLIWPHKGAGKGRGGTKGSSWLDKYGNRKKTNPESLGKMGSGGRVAKPFFNQVLDGPNGIDQLATIAAEELGDTITGNLFIK